ncbi:hypothetical protein INR49_020149, partial [Caranx melampygus]
MSWRRADVEPTYDQRCSETRLPVLSLKFDSTELNVPPPPPQTGTDSVIRHDGERLRDSDQSFLIVASLTLLSRVQTNLAHQLSK